MSDCAAVDCVLECLMRLINCDNQLILKAYEEKLVEKDQIQWFYEELQFLRSFLIDSEEKRRQNSLVKTLAERIRDVNDDIEIAIDDLMIRVVTPQHVPVLNKPKHFFFRIKTLGRKRSTEETIQEISKAIHRRFCDITEEMKAVKEHVMAIYSQMDDIGGQQEKRSRSTRLAQTSASSNSMPTGVRAEEEFMVALDDQTAAIKELLVGEGHEQQLKIVPIVGMPGLGKTTLARKVYNDPFIDYHFYVRAWIYVSENYRKGDLLLAILRAAFPRNLLPAISHSAFPAMDENENYEGNYEQLGDLLYKCLKGKRYLIVMDDVWDAGAWNCIKNYFPDDNNGSRVMVTTRLAKVVSNVHAEPHHLRFLNKDESWDLFQKKVFQKENCPPNLMDVGKQIVKKCLGVPLAIAALSGLLAKTDKTQDWWTYVAEHLSSNIVNDMEDYLNSVAISYNHLPTHLKSCFLYLAMLPKDLEIPVWNLICLWVAEGFIQKSEHKTLEEVAEEYLMDLVDRSLVFSRKKFNGRIKSCYVHDLWRAFCLRKAHEKNFLQQISERKDNQNLIATKHRRLYINSRDFSPPSLSNYIHGISCSSLYVRSFSSFHISHHSHSSVEESIIGNTFTRLKVLNFSSTRMVSFPVEVTQLVLLRYLALYLLPKRHLLPSMSNLWNLETFIVEGEHGSIVFSHDMWKMVMLKRLQSKLFIEIPCVPSVGPDGHPLAVANLETMGNLCLCSGEEHALERTLNLKKLKCILKKTVETDHFPRFEFLIHLETLKVLSSESNIFFHPNRFPPNLKSLTLSNLSLSWDQMSTIGRLPKLEVLKLSVCAFEEARWDTGDGEFHKLKFLKFQHMDIKYWNASSSHFPSLQILVIDGCFGLNEIPSDLGDIRTLEMIELQHCNYLAAKSVEQIQSKQQSMGNDELRVVIKNIRMDLEEVPFSFATQTHQSTE